MAYYTNPSYYGYYPQMQPMLFQQPMIYPQQTQVTEQPQMLPTQMSGTLQNLNTQTSLDAQSDSLMIWVQGKGGAQSYPVARGCTLPLFDTEGDYLYIKSVDANGKPLPLVTKVLSDPPVEVKAEVVESINQVDMSDYVTKESYDELLKKYSDLETRILDLETKPTSSFNSTFTGNTFNNTKKEDNKNESKFSF